MVQRHPAQAPQHGGKQQDAFRFEQNVHPIHAPPLAPSICPWKKLACGETRNSTAAAISSGRPRRPMGMATSLAIISALMFSALTMGVSTGPGATPLMRIAGANSRARDLVRPITPALAVQ